MSRDITEDGVGFQEHKWVFLSGLCKENGKFGFVGSGQALPSSSVARSHPIRQLEPLLGS